MSQPYIQASFNSGEWAPHLWARTDLAKYQSGAALLRNFFVDYRGGASTRGGTRYVIRTKDDSAAVRLIGFQASISVGFVLEFGASYLRFHRNGAPVLEATINITGATKADPCVISAVNSYANGDWVYITGVGGMTELNGKYYVVRNRTGTTFELEDLWGNSVDSSAYGTYTTGGTAARVYTLSSPYAAADLALLKFVQNVDVMVITHPDYVPYALTFSSATSWTLAAITFGSTATAPNNVAATNSSGLNSGSVHYAYAVTAVDGNSQESAISSYATLANKKDIRTVAGTVNLTWDPVAGAAYYNVYKADPSYTGAIPDGAPLGYIGNTTATSFDDSNITADFSQPPPTPNNPFATGSKVTAVSVTTAGTYTTAPTATFTAPPTGTTATGTPVLEVVSITSVAAGGTGYNVGDLITLSNGVVLEVATLSGSAVATATISDAGSATTLPSNPVAQVSTDGGGSGATFNLSWGVYDITITEPGTGYLSAPTISFSAGTAAATATIGPASVGNPAVPTFFQQRLCLAGPDEAPTTLYFSRPSNYYNYDISIPSQANDSITASIVSGQLANIKAMVPQPGGLIVFTDGVSFLINGGSLGSAITPSSITANAQSFLGANDMPPIVVNFDILSVSSRGSAVRDSTYNFYANVFTGTDISVLSSHLFFGYQLTEWAWVEEPFKTVWATRSDGTLLSLTFIKEQEFVAWSHHDTEDGSASFESVASIVEAAAVGYQNFLYAVVERTIGGNTVKYIEYFPERGTSGDITDGTYVTVDCSLSYSGSPATDFTGAEHLAGKTCTGLADGEEIPEFVMPANGEFSLASAASEVTVGLAFTPQLQTLYLDIPGEGTIQSKMKKINGMALRVTETLGLKAGSDSSNLVAIKDLVVGNVGRMTNEEVTNLVTGDVFAFLDPKWQESGQVFVEQDKPFPATILGYIPQVAVGDTVK